MGRSPSRRTRRTNGRISAAVAGAPVRARTQPAHAQNSELRRHEPGERRSSMAARRGLRRVGLGVVGVAGAAGCACACGAAVSPGFRRSCQFWGAVAPIILEHQQIKWRAHLEGCEADQLDTPLSAFHERAASQAVNIILRLGGIYVKIGQFASTMGAGILEVIPRSIRRRLL